MLSNAISHGFLYFVQHLAWVAKVMLSVVVSGLTMAEMYRQQQSTSTAERGEGWKLFWCLNGIEFCFRFCDWAFLTCKGEILLLSCVLTVPLSPPLLSRFNPVDFSTLWSKLLVTSCNQSTHEYPPSLYRPGVLEWGQAATSHTHEMNKLLPGNRLKYSKLW